MTNPTYIAADAVLVLMFTIPAWDAADADSLARLYTAKGFVTETTTAAFDGITMNAVNGYSIAAG